MANVLGIEAVPSESSLSRFFARFTQRANDQLARLHCWAVGQLPSRPEGYTLDLDSWALLHEDGHLEGVTVGYTRHGLKPCHRPLVAALAQSQLVAGYWLRAGNTACVNGAAEFLRQTVAGLPAYVRLGLVRADAGFGAASVLEAAERLGLSYIVAHRLMRPVQALCPHNDRDWQDTEVDGLQVQEVETDAVGRRLLVIRQRLNRRPEAGGKQLIEVPGYKFQALITNLPRGVPPLAVWRRYNGRAALENRIKELGDQFGIKRLTCESFWATEAVHHLAIAAYNLCVLLQRKLGQLEHCQLQTMRWRLFTRAAL